MDYLKNMTHIPLNYSSLIIVGISFVIYILIAEEYRHITCASQRINYKMFGRLSIEDRARAKNRVIRSFLRVYFCFSLVVGFCSFGIGLRYDIYPLMIFGIVGLLLAYIEWAWKNSSFQNAIYMNRMYKIMKRNKDPRIDFRWNYYQAKIWGKNENIFVNKLNDDTARVTDQNESFVCLLEPGTDAVVSFDDRNIVDESVDLYTAIPADQVMGEGFTTNKKQRYENSFEDIYTRLNSINQ